MNTVEINEEKDKKGLETRVRNHEENLDKLKQSIYTLKEKSLNWDKFKHIDMEEISSIVDHNKTMSSFLDAFLNRFSKMGD